MKRVGLSLSGGGARAMCYYGVLKALQEREVEISCISAHSWAAVLLVYIFSGRSQEQILQDFTHFSIWKFKSWRPLKNGGLINVDRLINYFDEYCHHLQIEDLPIKTIIHAADITDNNHPQKITFSEGTLAEAAVLTALAPPLFPLYEKDGRIVADGGFISLYSAGDLRRRGAEAVIGLFPDAVQYTKMPKIVFNLTTVIKSLNSSRGEFEKEKDPVDLELTNYETNAGLRSFSKAEEMFAAGYKKVEEKWQEIEEL